MNQKLSLLLLFSMFFFTACATTSKKEEVGLYEKYEFLPNKTYTIEGRVRPAFRSKYENYSFSFYLEGCGENNPGNIYYLSSRHKAYDFQKFFRVYQIQERKYLSEYSNNCKSTVKYVAEGLSPIRGKRYPTNITSVSGDVNNYKNQYLSTTKKLYDLPAQKNSVSERGILNSLVDSVTKNPLTPQQICAQKCGNQAKKAKESNCKNLDGTSVLPFIGSKRSNCNEKVSSWEYQCRKECN